jgi:hypothetical protein
MKGRRQVKEGFLSIETIETWICAIQTCNPTGFFTLNSFPFLSRMVCHPNDIQPI